MMPCRYMTIPEETPKWCFLILDKHDGEPIEHLSWQGYQKLIKGLKKRCVCTEEQHLKRGIPKNLSTCYVNQDLNYFADKLFKKVYGWTTYFCHWTHPNVMHPSHKSLQACCNDRFEYQYWKFGVGIPEEPPGITDSQDSQSKRCNTSFDSGIESRLEQSTCSKSDAEHSIEYWGMSKSELESKLRCLEPEEIVKAKAQAKIILGEAEEKSHALIAKAHELVESATNIRKRALEQAEDTLSKARKETEYMRKRAYEDVDDMLAKAQKDSKDIRKVDHDNVKRRLSIVRKEVEGIRKQTLEAAKTVRLKVRQDVDVILDHPCSASSKDCKIVVKDSSSSVDEKAPLYSSELNEPTEDGDKDAIRVDEAQNEVEDIGKDVHLDTNKDTANKFGHECEDVCKPINRKTSDINLKANEESKSRGPSSEEKKSDDASVPVICLS